MCSAQCFMHNLIQPLCDLTLGCTDPSKPFSGPSPKIELTRPCVSTPLLLTSFCSLKNHFHEEVLCSQSRWEESRHRSRPYSLIPLCSDSSFFWGEPSS